MSTDCSCMHIKLLFFFSYRSNYIRNTNSAIKSLTLKVHKEAKETQICCFNINQDVSLTLESCYFFLEYAFPEDTFILGDGGSRFLYRRNRRDNITRSPDSSCALVAVLFSRDRNKPLGRSSFMLVFRANSSFSTTRDLRLTKLLYLFPDW